MEYVFFTKIENGYKMYWTKNIDEARTYEGEIEIVKELKDGIGGEYKGRMYSYLWGFFKNKRFECSKEIILAAIEKNDWFYANIYFPEKKVLDKVCKTHITLYSIMGELYSYLYEQERKGRPVKGIEDLPDDLFYHSDIHYAKAALEDHFSPRKFTLEEVKGLIESTFIEKGKELKNGKR